MVLGLVDDDVATPDVVALVDVNGKHEGSLPVLTDDFTGGVLQAVYS